jgi:spermidine synthase
MIIAVTVLLAFCSMMYELLLSQALSAFLGNTLLRYSTTIGLYMFSLGCGASLAEKRWNKSLLSALLVVEALLALIGGLSIVILHGLDTFGNELLFSVCAHSLIIIIGTLSGFELPLLIAIATKHIGLSEGSAERRVLSSSYIGAFAATVTFAFYFYPHVGVTTTAFNVGLLNAGAGLAIALVFCSPHTQWKRHIAAHACLFIAFLSFWINRKPINQHLLNHYLSKAPLHLEQ